MPFEHQEDTPSLLGSRTLLMRHQTMQTFGPTGPHPADLLFSIAAANRWSANECPKVRNSCIYGNQGTPFLSRKASARPGKITSNEEIWASPKVFICETPCLLARQIQNQ